MLVSRRMEDYLRVIFIKDRPHLVKVAYRRDEGDKVEAILILYIQLLLDIVSVVFIYIDYDDLLRVILKVFDTDILDLGKDLRLFVIK